MELQSLVAFLITEPRTASPVRPQRPGEGPDFGQALVDALRRKESPIAYADAAGGILREKDGSTRLAEVIAQALGRTDDPATVVQMLADALSRTEPSAGAAPVTPAPANGDGAMLEPAATDPGAPNGTGAEHTGRASETGGPGAGPDGETAGPGAPHAVAASEPGGPYAGPGGDARAGGADIERSLELLVPEFRARLDRVLERMRQEGYEVRVTETWRAPDRQQALFAQGRTLPGPTVTWTRQSLHTSGRAADLLVNGSWGDDAAYARLQQIAAEEGLRTLGPADRGHVELPGPANEGRMVRALAANGPAVAPLAGVARGPVLARAADPGVTAVVAAAPPIARAPAVAVGPNLASSPAPAPAPVVASGPDIAAAPVIAHPPESAQVATVASPSPPLRPSPVARPPAARSADAEQPAQPIAAGALLAAGPARTRRSASQAPDPTTSSRDAAPSDPGLPPVLPASRSNADASPASPVIGRADPVTDAAARVARVLGLQDAAAAAPASGVTLVIDDAGIEAARIRLGMRGTTVGGTIDVPDPASAADLQSHIGELRRAIERRGLDSGPFIVRASLPVADRSELARAITLPAAPDPSHTGGRLSDPGSQDRSPGSPRRDHDPAEHRQQRQNKENRR